MASSDDEMNTSYTEALQTPMSYRNVEASLLDSDDDSQSSFTVDDMLDLDRVERQHQEPMVMDNIAEEEEPMEQEGGALHGPLPPLYNVNVSSLTTRRSRQLGVEEQVARVHLTENEVDHVAGYNLMEQLALAITRAIGQLLARYRDDLDDRDRLYFTLGSSQLRNVYDGWGVTVGEWRSPEPEYRVNRVFENLALMLNSNESFGVDNTFTMSLVVVKALPQGGGKSRQRHAKRITPGEASASSLSNIKRSILQIPRDDRDMCCVEALWTAYKRATLNDAAFDAQYNLSKRRRRPFQVECEDVQREVGIEAGTICGPNELRRFAEYFAPRGYSIIVVDSSRGNMAFRYGTCNQFLTLYYVDNHYHALRSPKGFFTKNLYCFQCFKPYDNAGCHRCSANTLHCPACLQDGCPDYVAYLQTHQVPNGSECPECCCRFYGPTCYRQHQDKNYQGLPADATHHSVCRTVQRCRLCGKRSVYHSREQYQPRHKCYHHECPSCLDYVDLSKHKCFIQTEAEMNDRRERRQDRRREMADRRARARGYDPNRPRPARRAAHNNEEEERLSVYFDIETMQERDDDHADVFRHVPNLVVAATTDGDLQHWYGPDCIREFVTWLDTLLGGSHDDDDEDAEDDDKDSQPKITVVAHNFQGYDSYFIIREYHRQARNLTQIRNGGKVLELKVGKPNHERLRFIDSMSFLPMPLYLFTKTFGFTENDHPELQLTKGFFPHFFNTSDRQDYHGDLPARHFYGPDTMSDDRYKDFDRWYTTTSQQEDYRFHFRDELLKYCEADVRLLRAGCEVFRREFQAIADFDPFRHTTIASACSRDLRKSRLQPEKIASEPVTGWRLCSNHSLAALEWLEWHGRQLGRPLRHVGNEGEEPIRVGPRTYHVDGFDPESGTIYEFHGCFWHGCKRCFPQARDELHQQLHGRTFNDVYRATESRDQRLRHAGYHLVTIWEHEWTQQKQDDEGLGATIRSYRLQEPLNPRDAFFGGRTNAVRMFVEGEPLHYYDFTSLYPWVNKYCEYPIGHPDIKYNPDDQDLSNYFGLAKCTILPPPHLFHPLLPYRCGGKLVFPLCRTCVEENIDKPLLQKKWICYHSREQRALTGTWCTPELEKATALGYELLRIHEVWDFPASPERRKGLFKDYVDTWLKNKEEASGFPDDCLTEAQRRQHVADYLEHEDVQLDYDNIRANPGKRAVAKLMLNSMWGKFGQRLDKTHVKEFTDARDLHDFLASGRYKITYVSPVTEDLVEVYYKIRDTMIEVNANLNIFVACFTTCHARLHLYEELERLGRRVAYFDTDSIIFTRDGDYHPDLGKYLGQFKDELKGDHITTFCSGGPKNYGYKTSSGKVCTKVRGFTLNREGSRQLNFAIMLNNVQNEVLRSLDDGQVRTIRVNESTKIVRNAKTYELFTYPRHKTYRLVANKRVFHCRDDVEEEEEDGTDPFVTFPYGYSNVDPEHLDILLS